MGTTNLPLNDVINSEVWMQRCFVAIYLMGWRNVSAAPGSTQNDPTSPLRVDARVNLQ